MQVGEVVVGAGRSVEADEIGLELDQIARDEPRREAEVAQGLYEQPGRIPAGALAGLEGLLRRLHARLHADDIADRLRHTAVEANDEIDRALGRPRDRVEKRL